jgi:hypothetical protein
MSAKGMLIYGYSKTFGLGDHELAKGLILKEASFSQYDIQTSNEGY